jgi:hypothetical protein
MDGFEKVREEVVKEKDLTNGKGKMKLRGWPMKAEQTQ